MKMVIPKQHGAWAMLLIPFLLGMLAGHPTIWHIPLLIGWLFLYLATFPFIMYVRKKKRDLYEKLKHDVKELKAEVERIKKEDNIDD